MTTKLAGSNLKKVPVANSIPIVLLLSISSKSSFSWSNRLKMFQVWSEKRQALKVCIVFRKPSRITRSPYVIYRINLYRDLFSTKARAIIPVKHDYRKMAGPESERAYVSAVLRNTFNDKKTPNVHGTCRAR